MSTARDFLTPGLDIYKSTQFNKYYADYVHKTKATMHLEHKPGETMQVDWAGQTAALVDNCSIKHQFCLTYEECQGLIQEIQAKLDLLKRYLDAAVGKCTFCGYPVYVDKNRYEMDSGEVIHGVCMERFIRSPASAKVRFPATLIFRQDVFGHARICGESFDPYLFPDRD